MRTDSILVTQQRSNCQDEIEVFDRRDWRVALRLTDVPLLADAE
jgi:hypothetical protein